MKKVDKVGDDYVHCVTLVADFFGGDVGKATLWMQTQNPLLGDVSPHAMIQLGRTDRLLKFIRLAAEEWENQK